MVNRKRNINGAHFASWLESTNRNSTIYKQIPYLRTPDYLDDSAIPEIRQLLFTFPETVNPNLLSEYGGTEYSDLQLNTSQTSFRIPENGPYQLSSPAHSTSSLNTWMGYTGGDVSASMSNPASPSLENTIITYAPLADRCICGCESGPCIPQRNYDRQRTDLTPEIELQEMILFSVNKKCGFPLAHALKKHYTNLDGRDEKVFVGFKSSISIRLEWLPYEKWTRQIRTLTWRRNPENITRAKLATEVAKRMKIFFDEMQKEKADISYYEYRVQPGVIDIDHLELVALQRVAKASYMPHFRSFTPSQSHSQ